MPKTYTFSVEGKDYEFFEPSFQVYAECFPLLSGKTPNMLKAGEIILKSCSSVEQLEEIERNPSVKAGLCLEVTGLLNFPKVEVKKN